MAPRMKEIKTLQDEMLKSAKSYGLTENYIFRNLWKGYTDQLAICDKLLEIVATEGYSIQQPAGKDAVKIAINPAVAEYNRIATLANKTAAQLIDMFDKAKKDGPPGQDSDSGEDDEL